MNTFQGIILCAKIILSRTNFMQKRKLALPKANSALGDLSCNESNAFYQEFVAQTAERYEYEPRFNSVEYGIKKYLMNIYSQLCVDKPINSYMALIDICPLQDDRAGRNYKNEARLLRFLNSERYFNVQTQLMADGSPCYYHVSSNTYHHNVTRRVSINCDRANISALTAAIIREFGSKSFYIKFTADQATEIRSIQDQIEILTNDGEIDIVLDKISALCAKKPSLFSGAEKLNPFVKRIDRAFSVKPEPRDGYYRKLDGGIVPYIDNYMNLLAVALKDAMDMTFKQLATTEETFDNIFNSVYYTEKEKLEAIISDGKLFEKVIYQIKTNLGRAQYLNPDLDIHGITPIRVRESVATSEKTVGITQFA